eukprot:TRINITY_DN7168_c0_g1_i1.p1 TRINITY_DN7168_c0_g1~~TRINITY_DN7168_c0_g1_i1.p1  ORF type:complete len:275 (+),score=59.90 TRINITY_DN7168_c0_g1_i1:37-861(+)
MAEPMEVYRDMMYKADMQNKVAVITGAGSGIGKVAAISLAKAGVKVAIIARREEKLKETQKEIEGSGGKCLIVTGDVSKEEDVKKMYQEVKSQWGDRIDYVVANAGVNGVWAPIEEIKMEEFDSTVGINLRGTFLTVKEALQFMKANGGAVVVISSINGNRTFSNTGATVYATTKAGQVAMTKMLAIELANYKIRINVVCPGMIDTNIDENTEHRNTDKIKFPQIRPEGEMPLTHKKPGTSQQCADLIQFLLSNQASHITGTEVYIDGGESLIV